MTVKPCDPVGAKEIAERLNVQRGTVDVWRIRNIGFPEPQWVVGGRPAWEWSDVAAWSESRGSSPARASVPEGGSPPGPPSGPPCEHVWSRKAGSSGLVVGTCTKCGAVQ